MTFENISKGLVILKEGEIIAKEGYIRVTNSSVNPLSMNSSLECATLRNLGWIVSYGNGVHWTYYFIRELIMYSVGYYDKDVEEWYFNGEYENMEWAFQCAQKTADEKQTVSRVTNAYDGELIQKFMPKGQHSYETI